MTTLSGMEYRSKNGPFDAIFYSLMVSNCLDFKSDPMFGLNTF